MKEREKQYFFKEDGKTLNGFSIMIHMLRNYGPNAVNTDENGEPKSCNFGDETRAKISGQCLKSYVRKMLHEIWKNEEDGFVRTKKLPQMVYKHLIENNIEEKRAKEVAKVFMGLGKKEKEEKSQEAADETSAKDDTGKGKKKEPKELNVNEMETKVLLGLVPKDIEAAKEVALQYAQSDEMFAKKDGKASFKVADLETELCQRATSVLSLEIILMGSFATSKFTKTTDACLSISSSIGVNRMYKEHEIFSALDDVKTSEDHSGAAMLGSKVFTSDMMYTAAYINIADFLNMVFESASVYEIPRGNLEYAIKYLKAALYCLINAVPEGKQHTMFTNEAASCVLIELYPIARGLSYANAFVAPVAADENSLVYNAQVRLKEYTEQAKIKKDIKGVQRFWYSFDDVAIPEDVAHNCISEPVLLDNVFDTVMSVLS